MIISIQLILHGIQCRIVGWITGKPVILSVIGKDVHQYLISWWGKIFLKPIVKRMNIVIAMGNESKRILRSIGVLNNNIFILQNFHDRTIYNISSNNIYWDIIYVGMLIPRKCVNHLIKALDISQNSYKLVIVGDGPQKSKLEALVSKMSLNDNIEFVGEVDDVNKYLSQSRLLVLPSKMEGLPAVAIEAMYVGLPAILPNICDIPTYFNHGRECLLFEPGDILALAKHIETILFDHNSYNSFKLAAMNWSKIHKKDWSIKNQVGTWNKILESTIL